MILGHPTEDIVRRRYSWLEPKLPLQSSVAAASVSTTRRCIRHCPIPRKLIAIAEHNPERRRAVGERFGIKGLYPDAEAMYQEIVPDIAAVVLPGKYIKDAVIASAEAGVKGVSTDKPIGACLADVDQMVDVCEERGVVFAGGNLQRALSEVQEVAGWLRAGNYGELRGNLCPPLGR